MKQFSDMTREEKAADNRRRSKALQELNDAANQAALKNSPMTEARALEMINAMQLRPSSEGGFTWTKWPVVYFPSHRGNRDEIEATLDGEFTADELEAIAWWMRNKKVATWTEERLTEDRPPVDIHSGVLTDEEAFGAAAGPRTTMPQVPEESSGAAGEPRTK